MEFNATFLVSAVSFIIFTLVMNKLLYQPLSEIIARRKSYLESNSLYVRENLDKIDFIRNDKEKKLSEARTEVKNLIANEVDASKNKKMQFEVDKKLELAQKISNEKDELAQEKEKASQELNNSSNDLSEIVISKLIGGDF